MSGFVYIMSNKSFASKIFKIGMSEKDPTVHRKEELYTTGIPHPFEVEYYAYVTDPQYTEKMVHQHLSSCRVSNNREFFECEIVEAVRAIREHAEVKYEECFVEGYDSQELKYQKIQKQEARRIEQSENSKKIYREYQERLRKKEDDIAFYVNRALEELTKWNAGFYNLVLSSTQDENILRYTRDVILIVPAIYKTFKMLRDDNKISNSTILQELDSEISKKITELQEQLNELDEKDYSEWVSIFVHDQKMSIQNHYKSYCDSHNISTYKSYLWNDFEIKKIERN